jgi:adenylate kinase
VRILSAGVRRILDTMDWGDDVNDLRDERQLLRIGSICAADVAEDDDIFVLLAPQHINGHSLMPSLTAFCDAAGSRPVVLLNPRLTDIPSANNVMSVRGRAERMEWVGQFEEVYHFRLIYNKPAIFPIYGCLRHAFGGSWELYKRAGVREFETYKFCAAFDSEPGPPEITDAIRRGD